MEGQRLPQLDTTPLDVAAAGMAELFLALLGQGLTPEHAAAVVAAMVKQTRS